MIYLPSNLLCLSVLCLVQVAVIFKPVLANESRPVRSDLGEREYSLDIEADFRQVTKALSAKDCVPVRVTVRQDTFLLRQLKWPTDSHYSQFEADGLLEKKKSEWHWTIPQLGGQLRYCVQLNHARGLRYDSRVTADWALFRADDLMPAASSRVRRNSRSRTQFSFLLPADWGSVTRYPKLQDHQYMVDNPDRLFDRPTGWVQLGKLGVRQNRIGQTSVAVSAPVGHDVRRLEILTLLSFTLPTIQQWFPEFPKRLLIVSATEEMWRGALSGPGSLFLHGERPLVSENGTSTLLHELVHVAMQRQATRNADWIDEGLAEYLALVLLNRSGGMTDSRFATALKQQKQWADSVTTLARKNSTGAATAKAVTVFAQLHEELGDAHFKELVRLLAKSGPAISPKFLRELAEQIAGRTIQSLP